MQRWDDAILEQALANASVDEKWSDDMLFAQWVAASRQLQLRGRVRSTANIPAELAESIIRRWSGGTFTRGSAPAVDVVGADGTTYQVKALRRTDPGRNSVTTLSRLDGFDQLVVIVLEFDLSVCLGLRVSSSDLIRYGNELLTGANFRRLTLTRKFCEHKAVKQIPRAGLLRHHPLAALVDWDVPRWKPESW